MSSPAAPTPATARIQARDLQALIERLRREGYRVLGPTVREGVIAYDELDSAADLPAGWTTEQSGGRFRLIRRDDAAVFGFTSGADSWKKFLFPATMSLWEARRDGAGFQVTEPEDKQSPLAFLGVRACELDAIRIQDKVFLGGHYVDTAYQTRRAEAFFVAVNCAEPDGTCFCASMKTGPRAMAGYDLALTERIEGDRHEFLVEIGSERGAAILKDIPHEAAGPEALEWAAQCAAKAAQRMGRTLDTTDLKNLLYRNYEHPRWDDVASRCLTCGNCTLVCPTCFCCTVEDASDLSGQHAERRRKWDSCFTSDFSYIYGGSVRSSAMSRYRQWLMHKLATWEDQFGSSGCVGCGRCITWCPVGIDLTEEVRRIRESETASGTSTPRKERNHANA